MPLAPLTVLATVVLAACTGGAPASNAPGASSAAAGDTRVPVTVTEAGCAPAALQATAGRPCPAPPSFAALQKLFVTSPWQRQYAFTTRNSPRPGAIFSHISGHLLIFCAAFTAPRNSVCRGVGPPL